MSRVQQLSAGALDVQTRILTGNNAVFLAHVAATSDSHTAQPLRCVYKPIDGEQSLWDFPGKALAPREVAAYLIDQATGWNAVPPTVLRDGPLGMGSCQLWIEVDDAVTQFDVVRPAQLSAGWKVVARGTVTDPDRVNAASAEPDSAAAEREVLLAHANDPRLAQLAVFDAVINNSDRKAGHLLTDATGRLWAIDHGISFHPEPKLRTVLWGWAGEPLPEKILDVLQQLDKDLRGALGTELKPYLDADERAAISGRVHRLLREARFPQPTPGWPVLPYPLF